MVGCGNFSVLVCKGTESQEIVWTFTRSCRGLLWPEHSNLTSGQTLCNTGLETLLWGRCSVTPHGWWACTGSDTLCVHVLTEGRTICRKTHCRSPALHKVVREDYFLKKVSRTLNSPNIWLECLSHALGLSPKAAILIHSFRETEGTLCITPVNWEIMLLELSNAEWYQ